MYFQTLCGWRLISNMYISRRYGWIAWVFAAFTFWYVVFEWNSVDYPSYAKGPCYSPNHAYYVTRHQTLWQATSLSHSTNFGTARLFDRSGKLLYAAETLVDEQAGPVWLGGFKNDPTHPPKVFFTGNDGSSWKFILSESPGNGNLNRVCYPTKIE